MYERVLIPVDGSDLAEAILPFAEKVAGPVDAEVLLLTVVEPLSPGEAMAAAGVMAPDTLLMREMEARAYVAKLAARLGDKGLRARALVRLGVPATEIAAAAADQGADLIAMTTRGRSGLGRIVFGSVAETVLRNASVPVLMFRMTEKAAMPAATATAEGRR